MEPTSYRTLFVTLFFALLFQFQTASADHFYDREDIQSRLEAMDLIVQPRYTTEVESYIKGYLARDGAKAKRIIARTVIYFPIFEKYLDEHNMPEDLKYLAVVESALNPGATSRVGATGLWQFMKETGADYGLRINSKVDERSCPNRSTEAAMKYLADAYERFGSWELALASYNCGAGNVLRAIRRAGGSKDYWVISKFLPGETRNFVPAFLGAAYIMAQYHHHDIHPTYPDLDKQLTESTKVYTELQFETIASVARLPVEVVKELNPQYKQNYVPAYSEGHYVILPRRVMQSLKDYLGYLRPDNGSASAMPEIPELMSLENYFPEEEYYKTYYMVAQGDQMKELGKIFSCASVNLKAWNNLHSSKLSRGQELIVWFPKELGRFKTETGVDLLPVMRHSKRAKSSSAAPAQLPTVPNIKPLAPVEMAPLPLSEPTVPYANAARDVEYLETMINQEPKKVSPLLKVRIWAEDVSIFKKKN